MFVGALILLGIAFSAAGARYMPVNDFAEWLAGAAGSRFTPALFLVLYVALALLAIPVVPLSVAAVLIWGWQTGATIELVCAVIAAVPPFLITRATARGRIESMISSRMPRAAAAITREGAFAVLLLRIFPLIPYNFLNYLAGLTSMTIARYTLITAVGMLPSLYAFAYLVDAARAGTSDINAAMPRLLLACGITALLLLAGRVARRRWGHRLGAD